MPEKFNFMRWIRYKYVIFIRIKDHPASIATGVGLGIFFDVLPTFGTGVIFAYFLATLLKVNRLATLLAAVVFKLAIPIFIYINVQMGQIFIKEPVSIDPYAMTKPWSFDWSYFGASFLLGSVINAVLAFIVSYIIAYYFVIWRRARKACKRK